MAKKMRLKKDIILKAGTIFTSVDDEKRHFIEGNYSVSFSLTPNTYGEAIYSFDEGFDETAEWFEEID